MGVAISKRNVDFEVLVKTGDVKGAGTDSNVYITFIDEDGDKSRNVLLDCNWRNDFEQGNIDSFKIRNVPNLGRVKNICLWRDTSGVNDDWFVEYLIVRQYTVGKVSPKQTEQNPDLVVPFNPDEEDIQKASPQNKNDNNNNDNNNNTTTTTKQKINEEHPYPINRWIEPKRYYVFTVYDSLLPQFDQNISQRRKEMDEKRVRYCLKGDSNDGPKMIDVLPREESFSNDYKWDIVGKKMRLLAQKKFLKLRTSSKWENLDALVDVYKGSFGIPYGYYNWKSDEKFGQQRLRGCNATMIELCTEIPSNFAVTGEMMEPLLDGTTLEEALEKKQIFIVNLDVLQDIVCKDCRTVCPAMALFHDKRDGRLLPLAIQLFQEPADDNPVFLPTDPTYTWMLAKMFFNNAECCIHQTCTHLGFTHLVCESICISFHRTLSPSHPVFRLMAPHFLYLIAINSLAVQKLLAPDGWIDVTMTMGVSGLMQILKKKWGDWRLDRDAWLPAELEKRGVADNDLLQSYMYRTDSLTLHQAIWDYVAEVINNVYDSPEALRNDFEVQQWAESLTNEATGCGLKGVFGGGKFEVVDDLIKTVTSVIFLSSVGHAAANFCQYDEYAFPPNYPAILNGKAPRTKDALTEADILSFLPNKDVTLSIMVVTKILSDRGTNGLGDFEVQYQYDPKAVAAVQKFRARLAVISEQIKARNLQMKDPYPYLDPEEVPNAISI